MEVSDLSQCTYSLDIKITSRGRTLFKLLGGDTKNKIIRNWTEFLP